MGGRGAESGAKSKKYPTKTTIRISMQFFAEKGLEKQRPSELRKGIRELQRQISEHEAKIADARKELGTLDGVEAKIQLGTIRHWEKEISNFTDSINNRKSELRKRGEPLE